MGTKNMYLSGIKQLIFVESMWGVNSKLNVNEPIGINLKSVTITRRTPSCQVVHWNLLRAMLDSL